MLSSAFALFIIDPDHICITLEHEFNWL